MNPKNRPNTLWPIGTPVLFLDAWGKKPVYGKVIRHYKEHEVLVEELSEVRHFGQTWRIATEPPAPESEDDFDDLLGISVAVNSTNGGFDDLLG